MGRLTKLRATREKLGLPVAALLDTKDGDPSPRVRRRQGYVRGRTDLYADDR